MNVNPWVLLPAECQQNESQFLLLQPVNGLIGGDQARPFFLKSGLPPNILAQIWQLADLNKDGKLDRLEFFIAMRLVRNCLSGLPLPPNLPESMKQFPAMNPPSFPPQQQLTQPQMPQPARPMSAYGGALPANYGSVNNRLYSSTNASYSAQPPLPTSTTPAFMMGIKELGDWSIPQHLKLRFSQHFNHLDKNRVGLLTGAQARGALGESQLPTNILAQIWTMADVNKDGCLSIEEFCVAMHFIEMVKSGFALPSTLPPELNMFCHRSKTASPLADPSMPPPQKNAQLKTFEDKRRDNLDRGQAELERRRQILREEEERRRAEIERKEREEEERRERERQELERRREAEREAERLREMERERERAAEEERIKAEREEARRKLDQERIKELEKIRVRDLEAQHQNELEKTMQFQQRHKTMTFQLQAMEEKSQQLNGEITEARDEIIGITGEIERMRESRDQKLARIAQLQAKVQELAVQCERLGHENLQLQTECQKTLCRTQEIEKVTTQIADHKELIALAEEELKNAKERLANQEKLVSEKRPEFEKYQEKLTTVLDLYNKLAENFSSVREEAQTRLSAKFTKPLQSESELYSLPLDVNGKAAGNFEAAFSSNGGPASGFESDFRANFSAAFASEDMFKSAPFYEIPPDFSTASAAQPLPPTTTATPDASVHAHAISTKAAGSGVTSNGQSVTARYRALFEFVARSEDELSLQPGDTILVFEEHASEPGWLAGQIKEKVGWFPAAFAERIQSSTALKTQSTNASIPTSPSTEPLESIKEESAVEKEFVADFSMPVKSDSGIVSNGTNGFGPSASSNQSPNDSKPMNTAAALYDAPPGDGSDVIARNLSAAKDERVIGVGVALYHWKARNEYELSFSRNEVIEVLEQAEMRWRGRLQKKPEEQGWFPKSYIKLTDGTGQTKEKQKSVDGAVAQSPTTPTTSSGLTSTSNRENTVAPTDDSQKTKRNEVTDDENLYVAIYQFDAVEATDLSLKPGDLIRVSEAKDEWWKGECDGKSGIFPANYVQKASSLQPQGKNLGRALAAFEATAPNQISLRVGDLVHIHSTSPGGWWEGEVDHDGTKLSGWFPGNYVQVLTEDPAAQSASVDGKEVVSAVALFDYDALHADELSFKAGDAIEVVDRSTDQWWKGRKAGNESQPMLFPANFVQIR